MRANISAGPLGTKLLGYGCIKKLVYKIDFHNKKQVIFSQKRETKNKFLFTKTIIPVLYFFKKNIRLPFDKYTSNTMDKCTQEKKSNYWQSLYATIH